MAKQNKYPLIIIGSGPAGLTASVYASRYKVKHVIIGEALGGLAFEAHKICNFPSEEDISGMDLIAKIQKHAESLGASLIMDKIVGIDNKDGMFKITTLGEKEFFSDALLLAVGTERRRMNLPDEGKFIGKGVSYCATCDAMFYRDKTVAVIGGSDSANTASLYLAKVAKKVYQIYRRGKLRGEEMWIEQIHHDKKIEVIFNTQVVELKGKDLLEKIILNKPYKGGQELKIDGLFVEIGTVPQKLLAEELGLETDEKKYIKVGLDQLTSHPGVWAAGDITTNSNYFHQIITACAEGAVAAESIFKFLQEKQK